MSNYKEKDLPGSNHFTDIMRGYDGSYCKSFLNSKLEVGDYLMDYVHYKIGEDGPHLLEKCYYKVTKMTEKFVYIETHNGNGVFKTWRLTWGKLCLTHSKFNEFIWFVKADAFEKYHTPNLTDMIY